MYTCIRVWCIRIYADLYVTATVSSLLRSYICGFVCNGNSELTVKELRKHPRKATLTVNSLLRERVLFWAGGARETQGTPTTPGSTQAEFAGLSSMLRYATLRCSLRCLRLTSLSLRFTSVALRFTSLFASLQYEFKICIVCVYVCIYIYMYIYICMCAHRYVYIYIYIQI